MPSLQTFRVLLVVVIVFGVAGNLCDSIFPSLIPAPLREGAEAVDSATPPIRAAVEAVIRLPLMAIWAISLYGFFTVRPWAPPLGFAVTLLLVVSSPLATYYVNSGWAVVFTQLQLLTWGAVVAVAYFSPLNALFTRNDR